MTTADTLPIPRDAGRVLLYGGAFDPPHRAHLHLPPLARDALDCDLLLYIPAAAAPLKQGPATTDAHRVAMLQAALAAADHTAIATLELERDGVSYTVDTLRHIAAARPDARLRFLIGADQARQFHKWRDHHAVVELAEPAVMLRPPLEDPDTLLRQMAPHWTPDQLEEWGGRLVRLPAIEASSTRVRELLASGETTELQTLLTPEVLDYIEENGLYRGRA